MTTTQTGSSRATSGAAASRMSVSVQGRDRGGVGRGGFRGAGVSCHREFTSRGTELHQCNV